MITRVINGRYGWASQNANQNAVALPEIFHVDYQAGFLAAYWIEKPYDQNRCNDGYNGCVNQFKSE